MNGVYANYFLCISYVMSCQILFIDVQNNVNNDAAEQSSAVPDEDRDNGDSDIEMVEEAPVSVANKVDNGNNIGCIILSKKM